ncbi:efflux RND transporter periplasmic adaptor subunit [Parafrigoribacterium soli]|uniref:hypothetical protein n=1 Tax=Parafrigoribacterium soli TaxID=3144663 RepID=UPI0032ECDC28
MFRRGRAIWIGAAAGAVLLIAGLLVGHYALPTNAAGTPPNAGLITVPVSYGRLQNVVTLRGQVGYANSLDVTVDTSALTGTPIVTGHVPQVGAQLAPLSVALEVSGRPLMVLPGALGAYRTLKYGMTGADVVQFKQAMRAVGLEAGDPANPVFDETAARSIPTLYAKIGYAPPAAADGISDAVSAARAAEQSAADALTAARNDLSDASAGPTAVAVRQADNSVRSAQRALDAAKSATPTDANDIANLQDALDLATMERRALDVAPNTSAQRLAVVSATRALAQARADLALARQNALPVLPLSEVLFVPQLPVRVDKVGAHQGVPLSGSAMTLSGTTVALTGSADVGDAKLLKTTDAATFALPSGGKHAATVTSITPGATAGDRPTITLTPAPLDAQQVTELAGQNVKVEVPVGATKGAVLSVPEAALSAGPGGETRVQVVDGDPRNGAKAVTRLVVVDTGLAADGQVEVTPKSGELRKKDLVVIAR